MRVFVVLKDGSRGEVKVKIPIDVLANETDITHSIMQMPLLKLIDRNIWVSPTYVEMIEITGVD